MLFVTTVTGSHQVYRISVHLCSWEPDAFSWALLAMECNLSHASSLRIRSLFLMPMSSHFLIHLTQISDSESVQENS